MEAPSTQLNPNCDEARDVFSGSSFEQMPLTCGSVVPCMHGNVPMGYQDTSNYFGVKFNRGWLNGAGGQAQDIAIGSTSLPIRPTPFNSRKVSDLIAATGYSSGQSLISNLDVNAPGRYFSPFGFNPENVACSQLDSSARGFITSTGQTLPVVFTALDGVIRAPTAQYNSATQAGIGGASIMPSVSYLAPHPQATVITKDKASARRGEGGARKTAV